MPLQIWVSGLWGLAVLLIWGSLLALVARLLPRLSGYSEAKTGERLEQEELRPVLAVSPRLEEAPASALTEPPSSFMAASPASEDALVAAAIGLALNLYQEEQAVPRKAVPARPLGSPWALAGRWQAMQARLNLRKRA